MSGLPHTELAFLEDDLTMEETLATAPVSESEKAATPPTPHRDKGEQLRKTVNDITTGRVAGEHPALDKLIGPDNRHWPPDVCAPNCPGRHHHEEPPRYGPLISDVFPTVPERMYRAEGDIVHLREELHQHRDDSIRHAQQVATKDDLRNVREEMDRGDLGLQERLEALNKRLNGRTAWIVLQTAALIASTAYALILSYEHFIQK